MKIQFCYSTIHLLNILMQTGSERSREMRQYLFRRKRRDTGEWVYGDLIAPFKNHETGEKSIIY